MQRVSKQRRKETHDLPAFLTTPYELGAWEGAVLLRRQLRSVFRDSLLTSPDSFVWQAAYKTCYHLCTTQQERIVFEVILLILQEEGEKADLVSKLPNSNRAWGRYIFPKHRSEYMFVCLILRRLGISRDLWLKIFVFSFGSFLDKRRACNTVLECCTYLSRFWIVDASSSRTPLATTTSMTGVTLFQAVILAKLHEKSRS